MDLREGWRERNENPIISGTFMFPSFLLLVSTWSHLSCSVSAETDICLYAILPHIHYINGLKLFPFIDNLMQFSFMYVFLDIFKKRGAIKILRNGKTRGLLLSSL